jgi:cold shock CspA family protein
VVFGVVATVRDSFGFVRCHNRPGPQLFFHASEVIECGIQGLRVGEDVKFTVHDGGAGGGGRDGKPNALGVTRLTDDDRKLTVVAAGVEGRVLRALRGRNKSDAYGGRIAFARIGGGGTGKGNGTDGGRGNGAEGGDEEGEEAENGHDPNASTAIGATTNTATRESAADEGGREEDGVTAAAAPNSTTAAPTLAPAPAPRGGRPAAGGHTKDEDSIDFTGMDLDDTCPRLKVLDRVIFDIAADRVTGERRAVNVRFLAPAPKTGTPRAAPEAAAGGARAEAAADVLGGAVAVGDGGGDAAGADQSDGGADGRELGRVEKLTASYGFIRSLPGGGSSGGGPGGDQRGMRGSGGRNRDQAPGGARSLSLFFHYTTLVCCREQDLTIGAAVWFGRGEDGRSGKPTAARVSLAPEELARAAEREEKAAAAAAMASATTGANADRWGKAPPPPIDDVVKIKSKKDKDKDNTGEDKTQVPTAAAEPPSGAVALAGARDGPTPAPVPSPAPVHAVGRSTDRSADQTPTQSAAAAAAALTAAADGFEVGSVAVMKASFGFIKCCNRTQDLFFHFTEVSGGEAAVSVGQDVRFRSRAGGDRRSDKPVAVRVSPVPIGTAVFERVSSTVLRGVCRERLVSGRNGDR